MTLFQSVLALRDLAPRALAEGLDVVHGEQNWAHRRARSPVSDLWNIDIREMACKMKTVWPCSGDDARPGNEGDLLAHRGEEVFFWNAIR